MTGVTAKIDLSINATLESDADFGVPSFKTAFTKTTKFTPGTATTAQADMKFSDQRGLADGANEELDLAGGLSDVFGNTLTFAEVTAIYFENAGPTDITIGGAASNAFVGPFGDASDTVTLKTGEIVLLTNTAGWAVTAGTADLLKVTNAAGDAGVYNIVLIGRSTAV